MSTQPPGTLNTRRPFKAKQAAAAGISRRRLLSSRYRRIVRGVYISADVKLEPIHAALAVTLVTGEEAFVSHHTAARLYGATVPESANLHASTKVYRHRSRTVGVTVHGSTRTPVVFRQVRVTTPEHTFLDLAGHMDLVDLVILGDSLVRKGRTKPAELVAAASGQKHNGRLALRAARLVRDGVDSPMETRLRLLVTLAGLPEPETNVEFRNQYGDVIRRVDLGYRSAKLGLEYDGRQHAESAAQYATDLRRREEFAALGWHLWSAVSDDIFRTPASTLARIAAVMKLRGMDVPTVCDDWRAHFPGRD